MKASLFFAEPIKIDKHPESKTATVGSKVTFECRGQEKSTKLLYQWFKDDEPLPNENASILVLDSVRLRDFGYYMCNVSHQDSYDEGSKSSLAKLDVTPDGESGMSEYLGFFFKDWNVPDGSMLSRIYTLMDNATHH